MKILAIRGEGIASLAGAFDVDLEKGPIGQAGIFAITGPTGSGKSSLLDAMCLALFDRTPRLGRSGGVAVGHAETDEALRLKEHDPRGLLSRGAGEGFAQVDFVGVDAQRYRATWTVARARKRANGRVQPQQLSLHALPSQDDLSGATKTETLTQIQTHLGLEYDQFRRSVLLAQGEFAEFLKAKASDRAELLERMTGTEIYARISKLAYFKAKTEGKALGDLRKSLETLAVLDPEARSALDQRIAAAELQAKAQASELKKVEFARAWYAEGDKCSTELSVVQARLVEQFGDWALLEGEGWDPPTLMGDDADTELAQFVVAQRAKLEQARVADATVEAALTEHTRVSGELTDAQREVEKQTAAVTTATNRRKQLTTEVSAHEAWLAQHATAEALAEDWALVEQQLRGLDKCLGEFDQVATSREALDIELPALRTRLVELGATHKTCATKLAEAKKEATVLALQVEAFADDDLGAQREQLLLREGQLTRLGEALRQHWTLRAELDLERNRHKQDKTQLAAKAAAVPSVAGRVEQAQKTLHLTRETLSLEDRRDELLHEGEACPLCGSPEHPYAQATPQAGPLVARLEAELEALNQEHERLLSESSKLGERIELRASTLSKAKNQISESHATLAALLGVWGDPLPDFDGGNWPDAGLDAQADIGAQLAQAAQELAAAKSSFDTKLAEQKKVGKSAKQAQAEQAKRQDELNASTKTLHDENANLAAKENVVQSLETRHQHAQAGAKEALAVLSKHDFAAEWQADLHADVDAFVHRQQERVTQWRTHHRQHDDAVRAIPVVDAELKAFESRKSTATTRLGKLSEQFAKAKQALTTHRTKRGELFAGRPSAEVNARLNELDTTLTLRAERAQRLKAHLQQDAPELRLAGVLKRREVLLVEQEQLSRTLEVDRGQRSVDVAHHAKREEFETNIESQQAEFARWDKLSGLIGNADGAKFRNYAQGLTLNIVLEYANAQLQDLRPRYRLMAVPGHNLEIQVVDQEMGDEVRPISSLSGGETFLASLALALGLAESTGSATAVESLFIDEGFGTLDGDTLELAIATLDALQDRGRTIGIISHVDGLAGRLGAQVRMVPQGGGRSLVEVVGGAA